MLELPAITLPEIVTGTLPVWPACTIPEPMSRFTKSPTMTVNGFASRKGGLPLSVTMTVI